MSLPFNYALFCFVRLFKCFATTYIQKRIKTAHGLKFKRFRLFYVNMDCVTHIFMTAVNVAIGISPFRK